MGRNLTSANSSHGGTSIYATIYSKDSFDVQESLFTLGLAIYDQDYIIQLMRGGALEKCSCYVIFTERYSVRCRKASLLVLQIEGKYNRLIIKT